MTTGAATILFIDVYLRFINSLGLPYMLIFTLLIVWGCPIFRFDSTRNLKFDFGFPKYLKEHVHPWEHWNS